MADGTAFLHSLMIQEKRGMLKVWNISLVLATGTLAVMGTFLVRSGILNSIHAFGGHTLGVPFVPLIALLIGASIYLVVSRRRCCAPRPGSTRCCPARPCSWPTTSCWWRSAS